MMGKDRQLAKNQWPSGLNLTGNERMEIEKRRSPNAGIWPPRLYVWDRRQPKSGGKVEEQTEEELRSKEGMEGKGGGGTPPAGKFNSRGQFGEVGKEGQRRKT
jgi:hypothetical protein